MTEIKMGARDGVREFLCPAETGGGNFELWFVSRDADMAREAALDRKNAIDLELAPQLLGEVEQDGWALVRLQVHTTRRKF